MTYHYPDHLSNRLETNSVGTVTRTFGHLPFGELWYETGTPDKWKFTGYERDTAETGLDYAMNRMYSSGYGRFQTADLLAGGIGDPQTLNRYGYVSGDPENLFDPSGMAPRVAEVATVDPRFYEFQLLEIFFAQIDQQFQDSVTLVPLYRLSLEPGSTYQQGFTEIDSLPDLGTETSSFLDSLISNAPSLRDDLTYALNFTKSLFSWKDFSAGFKEGGCFHQFAEEAFDPAAEIAGQDAAIKMTAESGAYVAATAYAAREGLIVPMRSSVVRGILRVGEVGGETVALGATIVSEGNALVHEYDSFKNGECQ